MPSSPMQVSPKPNKLLASLRRLHGKFDSELAAERARHLPDTLRVARLKKLKLAIKDRLLALTDQRGGQLTA